MRLFLILSNLKTCFCCFSQNHLIVTHFPLFFGEIQYCNCVSGGRLIPCLSILKEKYYKITLVSIHEYNWQYNLTNPTIWKFHALRQNCTCLLIDCIILLLITLTRNASFEFSSFLIPPICQTTGIYLEKKKVSSLSFNCSTFVDCCQ